MKPGDGRLIKLTAATTTNIDNDNMVGDVVKRKHIHSSASEFTTALYKSIIAVRAVATDCIVFVRVFFSVRMITHEPLHLALARLDDSSRNRAF